MSGAAAVLHRHSGIRLPCMAVQTLGCKLNVQGSLVFSNLLA